MSEKNCKGMYGQKRRVSFLISGWTIWVPGIRRLKFTKGRGREEPIWWGKMERERATGNPRRERLCEGRRRKYRFSIEPHLAKEENIP